VKRFVVNLVLFALVLPVSAVLLAVGYLLAELVGF